MVLLGVNIDHVATVREARRTFEPDPVWAAVDAELGGADSITIHVREDRRHIQTRDLRVLRQTVSVPLNLEMACDDEILALAIEVGPEQVTLVPERREEVTTEGGLDVIGHRQNSQRVLKSLRNSGIQTSLFLGPDADQLQAGIDLGIHAIELNTGQYAEARGDAHQMELQRLMAAAEMLVHAGVRVHAGHGLNYHNVLPVASISKMHELNIGHSIIARALFVGLRVAVREMKDLIYRATLGV